MDKMPFKPTALQRIEFLLIEIRDLLKENNKKEKTKKDENKKTSAKN